MNQDVNPAVAAGPSGPVQALPGAGTALALLLAINLFNFLDRQILAAVEPEIRREILLDGEKTAQISVGLLGLSGAPLGAGPLALASANLEPTIFESPGAGFWSGALQFAFLFTYMLIAPLFGWLGDRVSRWQLVALGVIVWSLASGASGLDWVTLLGVSLSGAYWLLFATRCLVGVGEGAYGPVAPAMLADFYPAKDRGRIMAWFYLAIPVGGALGYSLGGLVVNELRWSWHWAFYLVVPPGLLLGFLCWLMPEPPRGRAEAANPVPYHQPTLHDYLDLFRIPSYVLNLVGMTCMTFAIGGLAYWMAAFLELRSVKSVELGGVAVEARTFFGALTALAGLVGTLLGGAAGDRLRDKVPGSYFLVSGVSMLLGFPMVLLVLWTPFPLAWLFLFLAVFSLFFNTAPTNAINANVTHPAVRASAFALNILIIHTFGDALSPALIGLARSVAGLETGFLLVSLLMLVGGVFWIWGTFHLQHDTERAPTRLRPASRAGAPP